MFPISPEVRACVSVVHPFGRSALLIVQMSVPVPGAPCHSSHLATIVLPPASSFCHLTLSVCVPEPGELKLVSA